MIDSLIEEAERITVITNRERKIDAFVNNTEYIPFTKEETYEWQEHLIIIESINKWTH